MLFFIFIQPHIEYGLLIWGGVAASNLKPTQNKLKDAITKMSFKKNKHPAEPSFKQHKILHFKKQKTLVSACFMWRVSIKRPQVLLLDNFH